MRSKSLVSNSSKPVSSLQEVNKMTGGEMGITPTSDEGFVKVAHCCLCFYLLSV